MEEDQITETEPEQKPEVEPEQKPEEEEQTIEPTDDSTPEVDTTERGSTSSDRRVSSLPEERRELDVNTLPTRQYLDATVVPVLLHALADVARERPPDPVDYVANYLIRNKDKFQGTKFE